MVLNCFKVISNKDVFNYENGLLDLICKGIYFSYILDGVEKRVMYLDYYYLI